jgi:hypothetical protein
MGVSGQRHFPVALYPQGKDPHYPLDRRLGGAQSRSGHRGYRKSPFPGIKPRSPGHPVCSQTLYWLSYLPQLRLWLYSSSLFFLLSHLWCIIRMLYRYARLVCTHADCKVFPSHMIVYMILLMPCLLVVLITLHTCFSIFYSCLQL